MADNLDITQGSGTTIGADEIGGAKYQRVKVIIGADGTNDGDVSSANPLPVSGTITGITNSIAVHVLSTNGTMAVNLGKTDGTITVRFDPGYELGSIKGINNSVAVHVLSTNGTLGVRFTDEPTVISAGKDGTTSRSLRMNSDGAIKIYDIAAGSVTVSGTITGITNSIAVHVLSTGGTLNVRMADNSAGLITDDTAFTPGTDLGFPAMGLFDDTATDSVDEGDAGILRMTGNRILMGHLDTTASLFVASGSASGVSTSGNTIISPSANAAFKIHAFSVQTTGQVSLTCKFTNGSGSSPTEYWRPLITASGVTGAQGANLASLPSAPIFVTGTSTTLSLVLDSATLVHYSVAYTKESA